MINNPEIDSFTTAFEYFVCDTDTVCFCGITYYCTAFETLLSEDIISVYSQDTENIGVNDFITIIRFENKEYVSICDCWKPKAIEIIKFLESHRNGIFSYFVNEKQRLIDAANDIPNFGAIEKAFESRNPISRGDAVRESLQFIKEKGE